MQNVSYVYIYICVCMPFLAFVIILRVSFLVSGTSICLAGIWYAKISILGWSFSLDFDIMHACGATYRLRNALARTRSFHFRLIPRFASNAANTNFQSRPRFRGDFVLIGRVICPTSWNPVRPVRKCEFLP